MFLLAFTIIQLTVIAEDVLKSVMVVNLLISSHGCAKICFIYLRLFH